MSQALVRVNDNGTYDVLFQGATKTEAMAIREGFSTLPVNQNWAFENQGYLVEAVRSNSILAELHQEYKATIRDVPTTLVAGEKEEEEDTETTLEDLGFKA